MVAVVTRDQLARFLPDNDTIRKFEALFQQVTQENPQNFEVIFRLLQEVITDAGTAHSTADQANASLERIANSLDLLVGAPRFEPPPSPDNLSPPIQIGTMGEQQAERVRITGGTIDAVILGATTPAAATATVLTSTGATVVGTLLNLSGAAAGQIQFPATQNPSANANTLDDYEEGTYTVTATATTGALTAYTAIGSYTKIGREVTATVEVAITNNGTGAGSIDISLPFLSAATYRFIGAGRENAATGNMLQGMVSPSTSAVRVFKYDNTYPGGTGFTIYLTVTYFV